MALVGAIAAPESSRDEVQEQPMARTDEEQVAVDEVQVDETDETRFRRAVKRAKCFKDNKVDTFS